MKSFTKALLIVLIVCISVSGQTGSNRTTQTRPATPAPTPAPARPAPVTTAPITQTTVSATAASCGCEDPRLPAVLATVNGINYTQADLSEATRTRITQLHEEVIKARDRELDLQINSFLLNGEAQKRGVTPAKLLEEEVVKKTVEPTEAEANAYYQQNKSNIPAEFNSIRDQIISYLRSLRREEQAKKFSERLRAAAQIKKSVETTTPPSNPTERNRVFATVNGKNITSGEIEDALRPIIHSVQEQIYQLRKRDIDMKINDSLLEGEAQRRKVTARSLLDQEVTSKQPVVTEADAQKFFDENKSRISGEFAQVKYQIIEYLQGQAKEKSSADFASKLRATASIQMFLREPVSPAYDIAIDDQPMKGAAAAKVTVIEFTDYECPSCALQLPILERLVGEMGDRVRFVVRDFPLNQHTHAFKAAEAAEAAREQGKYWEYTALLFRNQSALTVANLKQYATAVGLDRARFDAALDGGKFASSVERDLSDGQKVGVDSTPTFFVNGKRVSDRTYEALRAAIDAELKK